jgi:predicted TIM-barrel fold metal-dependent hydrolase
MKSTIDPTATAPMPVPGPVEKPSSPRTAVPDDACDCHAHLFGPVSTYPYSPGRGYTPPEAPCSRYLGLLDTLRLAKGVVVQGNAHGYDNRVILDAVAANPERLRGVAITDARVAPATLADWHRLGMRGLRFHIHAPATTPNYVRGVGLDVFDLFRPMMRRLGWVAQFWCDWPMLPEVAQRLIAASPGVPLIIDHIMVMPPGAGIGHPSFQTLLRLLGDGHINVKLSGYCRFSDGPDYEDALPMHRALIAANPDGLIWGTDWPHTHIPQDNIPDDGQLVDLLAAWTPDAAIRQKILVDNPRHLFWGT